MKQLSDILIKWYEKNQRQLPWRETSDPYLIWISEVILQQTRVVQGHDYYLRFIRRFPTVFSLAAAPEDEVMTYWQGLGYYSRARNLHEAAKSMVHGFPCTYEEVRALKGVGEYTAAAICSICYNLPHAVVDGNVYRVLSRWIGIDTPIDSVQGKKLFSEAARELLDVRSPGLYNQALMEFGALQCTPQNPSCSSCPLADSCVAFNENTVSLFPVKQRKTFTSNRYFNYIYVRVGAHTYIRKRIEKDIWKNLYELPLIETERVLCEEELFSSAEFQSMFSGAENPIVRCVKKGVKHVLSHRIIYTDFYEVRLPETFAVSLPSYIRIEQACLPLYAMSKLLVSLLEECVD